jgi:predicted dehydrogenase
MKPILHAVVVAVALVTPGHSQDAAPPLRLAIAGLVHGHVSGFLRTAQPRQDVQIVGVFDRDAGLLKKYAERYKLPDAVLFSDLNAMLDAVKPEAVASFTNTYDHPEIVEAAAARRVHVMMEKPLAVSNAHAQRIRRAADKSGIHVLVNYETTWYPSHGAMWTTLAATARTS